MLQQERIYQYNEFPIQSRRIGSSESWFGGAVTSGRFGRGLEQMWLFGHKKKASEKGSPIRGVSRYGDILSIDSIDFTGPFSVSPTGRYTIGWCDADRAGSRGGFRESGEGSYVLLDGDMVVLAGRMERPNDGHVADNGTFVMNDWMFGEGLKGTFYAIDSQGNILVGKLFRANLHNNDISPDGRFALCQTCNSNNTDSRILTFFGLATGKVIWEKQPESGWANSYEFDVEKKLVYLVYKDLGKFAYTFSGEFLDADRWQLERIERADGFELYAIARDRFRNLGKEMDPNTGKEILSFLRRALQRGLDEYPRRQAMVHKTMGEVYEVLGEELKALEHFELALKLDPKVGVKRKLEAMKKGIT